MLYRAGGTLGRPLLYGEWLLGGGTRAGAPGNGSIQSACWVEDEDTVVILVSLRPRRRREMVPLEVVDVDLDLVRPLPLPLAFQPIFTSDPDIVGAHPVVADARSASISGVSYASVRDRRVM